MIRHLGLALAATLASTGTVRIVAAQSTRTVPVGTAWDRSSVNTAMSRTSRVPVSIFGWTPSAVSTAPTLDVAARAALDSAASRYRRSARALDPAAGYPRSTNTDGSWRSVPRSDWTSGFFPGTLWYLHEYTRDPELRTQAERWTQPLAAITSGSYDHDLGFQYYTSFGNALRITGDARFRVPLLDAAGKLAGRFDPRVGAIRSWSWGEWRYPVIVDNMMNLELLFWGAAHGGEARWRDIARGHADKTLANHVRADGGSFHVVDYDPATGSVTRRMTRQGFADSSTWARGQAWAIYGFTMAYRETRDPRYLATARRGVEYVVARLPADGVPCWDYQAPGCPQSAPRDASAAAIMASALLELSTLTTGAEAGRHRATAERMLTALTSSAYLGQGASQQSILVHAVGDLPRNGEVDVGINYADYYLVEALLRYLELRGAANVRVLPRPASPR